MKIKLSVLVILLSAFICNAQEVKFVKSYDQAIKFAKQSNKKIFIDFYTEW